MFGGEEAVYLQMRLYDNAEWGNNCLSDPKGYQNV